MKSENWAMGRQMAEAAASGKPIPKSPRSALGVTRVDKHTITVRSAHGEETFRVGAVFGPDCIQAEVWTEVRGVVQSAVDGYNVSVIACGPQSSGKTFTMLGGSSEGRGVVPRVIEEIFSIRDRDTWRASLEVDVQLFEIYDGSKMVDLLAAAGRRPSKGTGSAASAARGREAWGSISSAVESNPYAVSDTACVLTRRVTDKNELRQLAEDGWRHPYHPKLPHHVVLCLHITRTNRATGIIQKSRLTLVDLAGMGREASEEVGEAYLALEEVLKALAEGRRAPWKRHVLTEEVLKDCMGGSAKTVLMLALSPSSADAEDALAGIAFASCGSW